uniref:Uncharacterized protein n=1 Tax=Anguilla anguilla TaxID=7936 RepID=A0A0E9WL95_ANGAN
MHRHKLTHIHTHTHTHICIYRHSLSHSQIERAVHVSSCESIEAKSPKRSPVCTGLTAVGIREKKNCTNLQSSQNPLHPNACYPSLSHNTQTHRFKMQFCGTNNHLKSKYAFLTNITVNCTKTNYE